jgi:NAD(P)-dependent dehydrogenase (short-subunit alcohol dehydrogenase family)
VVLAALGHPLVLTARTRGQLEDTATECRAAAASTGIAPAVCHIVLADVGETDECERLASEALALTGHIDVLVNAAGIALAEPMHKAGTEVFARQIAVNLTAPYLLMRALVPSMRERGHGRIINIASVAGIRGYPYVAAYCASKHGLVGLTRAAAKELAAFGVTVNAVCPGYVDTPMTENSITMISAKTGRSAEDARKTLEELSPQQRLFTVEEVAAAVAYLASDGARGVNGQCLTICGGETA